MKFKVGDYVTVQENLRNTQNTLPIHIAPEMLKFIGKTGRIVEMEQWGRYSGHIVQLDISGYWWFPVDVIKKPKDFSQIQLFQKGKKIIAKSIFDEKTFSASASCHHSDDFDFVKGAALATERLFKKIEEVRNPPRPTKFSFEQFTDATAPYHMVVYCRTREECIIFRTYLHAKGLHWNGGGSLLIHHSQQDETCYYYNVGVGAILHGSRNCVEDREYVDGKENVVVTFNISDL